MKSRIHSRFASLTGASLVIAVSLSFISTSANAQTNGTWTLNGSGNWSDTANWSAATVASGASAIADFSTLNLTANQTVTLDADFTIGALTAGDATTASNNWTIAGPGLLTLNNGLSAPLITVTNQSTTLSAPLAGTSGLTKAGAGILYLGGNNAALSGTLTVQDVPATNNNGIVVTSDAAVSAITGVNIQGSATTGGFFQLEGGVTLPSTAPITLASQGGNATPPGAIRSTGTTSQINTINSAINVTFSGSRISNNSARRLDINGPISGTNMTVLFRNAANEGIKLTNTSSTWSGTAIHSGGTLWLEPLTALPSTTLLTIAASDPGTIQGSGTFSRSLGDSIGNVRFTDRGVSGATRAMGFSARGGALTINLGGAAAEVPFNNFTTNTTGTVGAINSNTLWLNNSTADSKITVLNPLNLNGADRTFQVDANTAELAGGITGSNNITKTGAGTLLHPPVLDASTVRTITVNGGTFEVAGGITGGATLTKAGNSLLNVSGGISIPSARTLTVSAGTLEASGGLNGGTFTVTKGAGAGTLLLSGASTWTGNLASAGGSSANQGIVRITNSLGLGPAATAKTISMRGDNRSVSVVELSGGVDIDANKTLNMSGKSFYVAGNAPTGLQYSLTSSNGTNTWRGNIAIAETGGAYGIESQTGSTLVLGADTATSSTIRNTVAASTRAMSFFGGGDVVINSKIANNGTALTGISLTGSGTVTLARQDNDFTTIASLNAGTAEVTKMTNNGTASSIGTASSFNLGGTLRYTGTGDTSNRTLSLYQKGGTLDADGSGPLLLTSPSFSNLTGSTFITCAPFGAGATTLTLNDASTLSVGQGISGTNIAAGATITAINPGARTITLSLPTTAASANALTLAIAGGDDIDRTLTLDGTNTGDNLLAGALSNPAGTGKLGITKTGPGKWVLSGSTKTNTGPLNVQQGALELRNSAPTPSNATVAAGAALILNSTGSPGLNVTGNLTLDGTLIAVLPPGTLPGTYPVATFGSISGSGSFVSTYRGTSSVGATSASVTVTNGIPLTWTGTASSVWDVKTSVNWQDGSTNPETFHFLDSVTFDSTGSSQPNVNILTEVGPSSITVSENTVDYSLTGTGFISGAGSLVKSGSASLTLATANTYSGGSTLNAGRVRIGHNTALGSGSISLNGGSISSDGITARTLANSIGIDASTTIGNATDFGSLTFSGPVAVNASSAILEVPSTAIFNGVISGNGFTKTGTGNIVLAAANTFTGATTFSGGTVFADNVSSLGTDSAGTTIQAGAQLNFSNIPNNSTFTEALDLAGTGGDGTGAIRVGGAKTVNLTANHTLSAATLIKADGGADLAFSGSITGTDTNLEFALDGADVTTLSGGINLGTGSLVKSSSSTLLLTGTNTYGATTINGGTLRVGNRSATGTLGSGDITNNGILQISRSDTAFVVGQTISGTGAVRIGTQAAVTAPEYDSRVTLSGENTFTGGVTIFSGGLKITRAEALGSGTKTIDIATNGTNGRPQFYLDGSTGDITLPASVSFLTSSTNLAQPAVGNLAGNNVIQGNFNLTSGGGSTAISVLGGSLTLNGNFSANATGRTLILGGTSGAPGIINGIISNGTSPVGITVSGGNTWTFNGNNTYTGVTAVNSGTLLVNGDQTTANGAITVNSTATLGGTGITGAPVTLNTGATLAPGAAGIESLATGALTIAGGSTLAIEINTSTASADQLVVSGNVDLTGPADLTLADLGSNATLAPGTKLVIADYSGVWDDTDIVHFNGNPVPNGSTITLGANSFVVDYSDDSLGGTAMTLTVPGGGNPYTSWADSFSLTGGNRAPSADPDNDGLENGVEFVIGSNPTTATTSGKPSASLSGGNLVFTFKRSDESEAVDVFVEYGTTLATWPGQFAIPAGAYSDANVTVINNDPGLDDVTVTIPVGSDTRKFARLRADVPYTP